MGSLCLGGSATILCSPPARQAALPSLGTTAAIPGGALGDRLHLPFGPIVLAVGSHFVCKKRGSRGAGLFLGVVLFTMPFHSIYSWPCQLTARPTGGAGEGRSGQEPGSSLRLAPLCLSAQKKPVAPQRGPFQSVEVKWPLRGKGWTYCVLSCPPKTFIFIYCPYEAGPCPGV